MEHKKRKIYFAVGFFIAAFAIIIYFSGRGELSFQKFTNTVFMNETSGNLLNLHYTLANPQKYHIDKENAALPTFSINEEKQAYATVENYLSALSSFDTKQLTLDEQYTYDLLNKKLEHRLKGNSFFYFNEFFSPSGGIQGQYPILLTEYTFRQKEDITDYLSLLSNTCNYFDSLMIFETEKAKRGFFMPDYSLSKTVTQCSSIIELDSLNSTSHFLQTTFEERIQKAIRSNIITTEEGTAFIAENNRLLKERVYPAYQNLGTSLSALSGSGKNENGLFYYPQGKEYYEWLFTETTGSYTDLDTVYNQLAQDYYDNIHSLTRDLSEFQASAKMTQDEITYFPLSKPEEMLTHLNQSMNVDFPSISSIVPHLKSDVSIKEVSSALEDYTAPAY